MGVLLALRVVLFALPGLLAWVLARPNLNPRYLPAAAWVCVGLSVASVALAAVAGAVVPRAPEPAARPRPRPADEPRSNGAPR
jgi:hypothetical protein